MSNDNELSAISPEIAEAIRSRDFRPRPGAILDATRQQISWAAEAPSAPERDELLAALLAAERSIGRLEGAKHEREANQPVMTAMAAVAAAGWVLAFCIWIWK